MHVDREAFARDGFVRLDQAFPRDLALRCQEIMWSKIDEDPDDPSTWTRPVVRLMGFAEDELVEACTNARWVEAIHELCGPVAHPTPWLGGTVAIRFPVDEDPGDDGWHIDGSFTPPGESGFWVNARSDHRALLMLVLFSDVDEDDAPTRIRVGSHHGMVPIIEQHGERGHESLTLSLPHHDGAFALATGGAGDVYLCHPFVVHAAQRNVRGRPRFVAQPAVPWRDGTSPGLPPL
jgi:hypothetical protein